MERMCPLAGFMRPLSISVYEDWTAFGQFVVVILIQFDAAVKKAADAFKGLGMTTPGWEMVHEITGLQ